LTHEDTKPRSNWTKVVADSKEKSKRNFNISPPELGTTEFFNEIEGDVPYKITLPVSGKKLPSFDIEILQFVPTTITGAGQTTTLGDEKVERATLSHTRQSDAST